ncbi:MAG: hypothetical protein ACHQ9S_27155 [Candidatus Binatia bacterium]
MDDEMIRDATRSSVNLGIDPDLNAFPDAEIHQGDASQFTRDARYLPGHARLSPGDSSESKPAAKSENIGMDDPMQQPTPTPHPIRASDFAREMGTPESGGAAASPGNPLSRGPVTPEVALFGAARARFDFGQLTPVNVGNIPNNDDAGPIQTQPTINKTPEATSPWGPPDAWNKE